MTQWKAPFDERRIDCSMFRKACENQQPDLSRRGSIWCCWCRNIRAHKTETSSTRFVIEILDMPAKKKLERKTRKLKRLCKRSTESAIIFGRKMFNLERRTEHPGTVSDNCARIFFGHVSEVGKLSFVDNRNTAFWSRKRIHFPRFISFIFRSNKKMFSRASG